MPGRSAPAFDADRIIGDRMAQLRMRHGWTQRAFADRLKLIGYPVQRNTINDLEQGNAKIKVGELIVLAMVLEVSPVELLMPSAPTDLITISSNVYPEMAIKIRLWILGHGAMIPAIVKGDRRTSERKLEERRRAERFYNEYGRNELDQRRFVQSAQRATRELTEASIVNDHDSMLAALDQLEQLAEIGRREIAHEREVAERYDELAVRKSIVSGAEAPTLEEEARQIVEEWSRRAE